MDVAREVSETFLALGRIFGRMQPHMEEIGRYLGLGDHYGEFDACLITLDSFVEQMVKNAVAAAQAGKAAESHGEWGPGMTACAIAAAIRARGGKGAA